MTFCRECVSVPVVLSVFVCLVEMLIVLMHIHFLGKKVSWCFFKTDLVVLTNIVLFFGDCQKRIKTCAK